MSLTTMEPNPVWDEEAYADVVDAFADRRDDLAVHVWGADWCGDCRSALPDFAAALAAAEIPDEQVHVHSVDRDKDGELVEAYGVEYIPTVVVERDGEEVARFVESGPVSAAEYLADQLADVEVDA